jgi:nitrogen fixation NifU-like protein
MAFYSEKVMEHFRNPRNVGEIEDADGIGEVGNPVCGDMMTFYIKVENNILKDVKFKTFGCGAAIAVSSIVSEMAKGKTIEEALKITKEEVAKELGGLPPNKMHCSNLGTDALRKAIEDYLSKKKKENPEVCKCPFCEEELMLSCFEPVFCKKCNIELKKCNNCGEFFNVKLEKCPKCGFSFNIPESST